MADNHWEQLVYVWDINFGHFSPKKQKQKKNEFLDPKIVAAANKISLKALL